MYPYTAANPPLIALGAGAFSYEFWYHWRRQPRGALGGNWWQVVGYYEGPDYVYKCSCWPQANWLPAFVSITAYYDADTGAPPAQVDTGPYFPVPTQGWHHYALNYDRVGNLEIFIDGISVATVAIDNIDAGNARFYALTTNSGTLADCDVSDDPLINPPGELSLVHAFGLVGPVAAHSSLLTAAQLRSSLRGKRVQNLATTVINWNWRNIEGHTGWETDQTRIVAKAVDYLAEVAAPLGVNGTVVVPDMSGNGNDYVLPTTAAYGTPTADKANVGFMVDPFWVN